MATAPRFLALQEHAQSVDTCVAHADLAGPIKPKSIGGMEYVLVFVDAWTQYVFALQCKKTSDVPTLLIYLLQLLACALQRMMHFVSL